MSAASEMKEEYDFSNAERGRFYRPGAVLRLPAGVDESYDESNLDVTNQNPETLR